MMFTSSTGRSWKFAPIVATRVTNPTPSTHGPKWCVCCQAAGRELGPKELAAVTIWSCMGHCRNSSPRELKVWMKFIFNLLALDRCTTSTCSCWVPFQDHEVFDDSVGFGAIVVTSMHQLGKLLTGLWSTLALQLQHNGPMLGSTYTLAAGCGESGEVAATLKTAGSFFLGARSGCLASDMEKSALALPTLREELSTKDRVCCHPKGDKLQA
ncbi:hypothetical protein HJG60_008306 [Phyllostomus discolor]|uniref:Uncharacterized protein n=1 Tax=Phyllostomus discolor TaxID=89673 RepID=A0A834DQ83_9CHIR|nr:hypothetical protein HJG60_008306 [Phyllostomus discolor]